MLGYRTRAMGTGRTGIRFSDGQGGYQGMRSPCTPGEAGGPSALVPASANGVWQCVVGVLAATGEIDAATAAFLASLDPEGAVSLNALDPITSTLTPLIPGAVADVDPLVENTTSTFELGYRGLLGDRLFVQSALWHTTQRNLASPLTVATPLLTLNGGELAAFLVSQGIPTEQAQALAQGAASVPGGVLSSSDIEGQGAELVATYENFGEIRYWGADLAAQLQLSRNVTVRATGSYVSDDHFDVEGRLVPLNAPALKGSLGLGFDGFAVPVSGEVGLRYQSRFPVASGDYVGTACVGVTGPLAGECVPDATLLDAAVSWTGLLGSDATVRLAIRNLLDEDYQPFLGVPVQGRQILVRMEYRLR
jgi:iron complex outermembrane receptor protein